MDPLQFGLFFAALLIGYVLVHLRLARFETHLREIAGLRMLNERLQGVSDALKAVTVETLEDRVEVVCAELRELRQIAARMECAVADNRAALVESVAPDDGSPADRVRELVESHLAALGYTDVQILSDLSASSVDEDLELVVECSRQRIVHKGKVLISAGGVRDVRLRNATQSFP